MKSLRFFCHKSNERSLYENKKPHFFQSPRHGAKQFGLDTSVKVHVKKSSALIDELRKAAELFFDSNPNASAKSLVMPYFTRLEEEEYIPAFLDRFASDEETVSDALLYNR